MGNFKYDVIRYLNLNGYSDLYSQLPSNQQEITSNIQFENVRTRAMFGRTEVLIKFAVYCVL